MKNVVQQADVECRNCGSIIQVRPVTPAAKTWVEGNVKTEGWQWMGDFLCIEHRLAIDLMHGMKEAGLKLADVS